MRTLFAVLFAVAASVLLLWAAALARQQPQSPPRPVEGDFVIKDFVFKSGETLPELKLHYRTVGTLRKDTQGRATNAVLILPREGEDNLKRMAGFAKSKVGQKA